MKGAGLCFVSLADGGRAGSGNVSHLLTVEGDWAGLCGLTGTVSQKRPLGCLLFIHSGT